MRRRRGGYNIRSWLMLSALFVGAILLPDDSLRSAFCFAWMLHCLVLGYVCGVLDEKRHIDGRAEQ